MEIKLKKNSVAVKNTDLARAPGGLSCVTPPLKMYDIETGKLVLYAEIVGHEFRKIQALLKKTNFGTRSRQSGMVSSSRTFGWLPSAAGRARPACYHSSVDIENPEIAAQVGILAKYANEIYAREFPEDFKKQFDYCKELNADYLIKDTVYTSGIINKNTCLPLHYDRGNVENTISSMYVFRDKHHGGNLALPEYGVELNCVDKMLVLFCGQAVLHGNTPVGKLDNRYSLVFYAFKDMWKCLSPADEINRANEKRTAYELKRYKELV